jgi:hypothetical protein
MGGAYQCHRQANHDGKLPQSPFVVEPGQDISDDLRFEHVNALSLQ